MLTIPVLNSNAGANFVIYLDFDGHTMSGTDWQISGGMGSYTSPAFDTDGNAAVFGAAEQAQIRQIFARVAEDFRPFNVNVTTQDPGIERLRKTGGADTQWGVRAVIGGSDAPGVLGVALRKTFASAYDTPCFIFSETAETYATSSGLEVEKIVGETVSHEVGHTLGLDHDGTTTPADDYYLGHGGGQTGWAPIMGGGEFRNVTQWSDGIVGGVAVYPNASNGEDDLAIITDPTLNGGPSATYLHNGVLTDYGHSGLSYRADDHGNVAGSATLLTGGGSVIVGTGIIERNTDVDAFAVDAAAGVLTINVDPAVRGPNLDVLIQVYDSLGTLIATSNPFGLLSTTVSTTVAAAGRYYIRVQGTGKAAAGSDPGYSNYGSLGEYTVRVTRIDPQDVIGYVTGGFRVGISNGASFTSVVTAWPVAAWDAITYGDFNGDGQTDVLGLLDGGWRVGIASGGTFTQSVWGAWANIAWQNVVTGDLNGDGLDDILARTGGNWWAALSTGTAFASPTLWTTWAAVTWEDAFLADITGDGKDDLLARTGWGWWTAASTGTAFGAASNFTTWGAAAWDTPRVFDANGDGRADLVGRLGNTWWVRLSSSASTTTTLWATWGSGVTWADGRTGDMNGDGFDDVLARDSTSGQWWIGYSNGSSGFTVVQRFAWWNPSQTWVDPTVGDFNGDGRDDLAGRLSTGQWWVTTSNGDEGVTSYWGDWPVASWQYVTAVSVRPAGGTSAARIAGEEGSGSGGEGSSFLSAGLDQESDSPLAPAEQAGFRLVTTSKDSNITQASVGGDEDDDSAPTFAWSAPTDDDLAGELLLTLADELLSV